MESLADLVQLSEDYSKMCLQDKYSDVTLVVADEKIPAHKNVLAARSCYFEQTFDESASDEILFEVSNVEAFKFILQYIYTGCIAVGHLEMNMILTILGLAQQYFLSSLEELLTKSLKTKCNIENVVTILNFARANQIQHLLDDCETFLDANSNDMLAHESFFLLSEESVIGILKRDSFFAPELDIFKAVAKWSQDSFEKAKKVANYVRMSLIKPVDITQIVRPTGIIDDGVLLSAINDSFTGTNVATKRAFKVIDKDVASPEMGAKFLSEEVDSVENYRYHKIPSFVGIMVELKEITFINNIRMLLWQNDDEYTIYSYYIQVSTDQKDWMKIIDYSSYFCRSLQDLYFEPCAVKYINIVATDSYKSFNEFRLLNLEVYCRATIPRTFKSFIYVTYNVASLEKGAVVWGGDNNACLDGNYTNYNETEGYSSGSEIWIKLAQPYMLSYIKFLLLDCDNSRSYNFKIETWPGYDIHRQLIANNSEGEHRSWQTFYFDEHPVTAIYITSTQNSEPLRIIHFECMYKSPEEGNILKGQEEAVSSKDLKGQEVNICSARVKLQPESEYKNWFHSSMLDELGWISFIFIKPTYLL